MVSDPRQASSRLDSPSVAAPAAEALALLGGTPVVDEELRPYNSMGQEELAAVERVVESGCLSGFYGSWGDQFFGGPEVRAFEEEWATRFGVRHAVSVNSATSGLSAAMAAVGVGPGDEVIVPPLSMSATVMAPLIYGGIPIFVDVEDRTFCIDPAAVRRAITPRTKAIVAVNLFGHPASLHELRDVAEQHGVWLIEDNAQGPLAAEHGVYCGTIGHIGVFSLNYHKHLHTGEGGMCVTNDDRLAERLALVRNHGENAVEELGIEDISNLIGFNFRMTELSAAIGRAQLRKVDRHVDRRRELAARLTEAVEDLEGLHPPVERAGCHHVYYLWSVRFDEDVLGVPRERFSEALAAEGFPHFVGYVRPLYLLPVFQRRVAIGGDGYPFDRSTVSYEKGLCPVAERMYESELICFETCLYDVSSEQADRLGEAIRKVHDLRDHLSNEAVRGTLH